MAFTFLADPADADALERDLHDAGRIALDCEAAGFHRYSDRLCLVQLSTPDRNWILDPLAFDLAPLLGPTLEDPDVEVLMHGADFDVRLLRRDLGIGLRGLFDTQIAAALLGETALGLASLLEKHLDVRLSKKYQRADWAKRPLPEDMLEYAAADTVHLFELAGLLRERLEEKGRLSWAEEEFRDLQTVRFDPDQDEDPVTRVKGAHQMPAREVAALREALGWRDEVAQERDRAAFRIAGDQPLVTVVQQRPRTVEELGGVKGFNPSLAREEGGRLLERLERVERLEEPELVGYPPTERGPGRPPPEVEERVDRLKAVRNRRSEELGIDRGTLLSNAVLLEIAQRDPGTPEELLAVPGVKQWQMEALGDALLTRLTR